MEALRILKTISSDRIPELLEFKGRSVEIIILTDPTENDVKGNGRNILNLKGSLKSKIDGMEFQNSVRSDWER